MEINRAELLQPEPEVLLSEPSKLSLNRDCRVVEGQLNKTKTSAAFIKVSELDLQCEGPET